MNSSIRLAVIGASIMSGYGLMDARTLDRELTTQAADEGVVLTIESRSSPGATVKNGAETLRQLAASAGSPDRVLITLGLGDAFYGVTADGLRWDLDGLLKQATSVVASAHVLIVRQVLFQSSLVARLDSNSQRRWPLIFDELGCEHGVGVMSFFLREVVDRPELFQADGIHPNAEGAATVARTLWADMRSSLRGS